jgi:hypothetical protein
LGYGVRIPLEATRGEAAADIDIEVHLSPVARGASKMSGLKSAATLALVLGILDCASLSQAQEDVATSATEDGLLQPGTSRNTWRQKIEDAKRRARDVARERREHPELYMPIPEDPDLVATERVLNDESLQAGDIVSTNKGLFVFRGRIDQPRSREDFVPLRAR